ncbi:MAG: DNA topoisomerase III [Defluviitaleaceae bacterium]|nr:DNA topoisomerase III [Defluviitaleaceae bacterium]
MKKLVIAEKPSVGKDIARALGAKNSGQGYMEGKGYIVTWALGHLVTLQEPEGYSPRYKNWELDHLPIIPEKIQLTIIPQSSKQFGIIKSLLPQANEVIIATDAGREGELVARWILDFAKNKAPIKRLWISSVTEKAILDGFRNLKEGSQYVNLYNSAYARAIADWFVGINATRALTTKFNASLSCGRVQTPTLAIIAKRDGDIQAFTPKEFYQHRFIFGGVKFTCPDRFFEKAKANEILKQLQGQKVTVKDVTAKLKKSHTAGYDLTSLQQDANRLYGFSAKETLNYTQQLYERHKVLTYPRTDSKFISADIVGTLQERVKAVNFGEYRNGASKLLKTGFYTSAFVNDAKVTDHHAIIPTEEIVDMSELGSGERKIYNLVVKKFLAMLYPPHEYEQTTVTIEVKGLTFTAKGNRVINQGYKEIYGKDIDDDEEEEDGEAQNLPVFKKAQPLDGEFTLHTGKTTPPSHFTEGTLLQAMENPVAFMEAKDGVLAKTLKETGGLGTVATRADIIEKLFNTALIETRGKHLHITGKGRQLLELAPKDLRSPVLTAQWEQQLSKIAGGELKREDFLKEIKIYTQAIIKEIKASEAIFKHTNITTTKCPDCSKLMLEIQGKKGKYLLCQDRECGHRKHLEITTNARCPKCHKRLTLAHNKFVCQCGHKESKEAFDERRKREGDKLNKKDVQKYIQQINKKDDFKNNTLAEQLSKLKF